MCPVDEQVFSQIKDEMKKNQMFFQDWFNATISQNALNEFADKLHPNWRLVNKDTPMKIISKENFLKVWPTFYGRFKDKPVTQIPEIKSIEKLSEEFYLVTYFEITEMESGTNERPISTILIKDKKSDKFLIYYIHE